MEKEIFAYKVWKILVIEDLQVFCNSEWDCQVIFKAKQKAL